MTNDTVTNQNELTIIRDYDAPRELVFRAMLEPEHLTHFWGPTGTHTPLEAIVLEPWAGGRFETTIVPDGAPLEAGFTMKAVFVEVVDHERIVFKDAEGEMVTESTFIDLGDDRTRVEIRQTNMPPEYVNEDAQAGFKSSLDKFAAHLATLAR